MNTKRSPLVRGGCGHSAQNVCDSALIVGICFSIGVGTAFISAVANMIYQGSEGAIVPGMPLSSTIATAHPGLSRALRKQPSWTQIAARLHGDNKARIRNDPRMKTGYGGHLRAIQTFRYIGPQLC